jgi:hypothetical protein
MLVPSGLEDANTEEAWMATSTAETLGAAVSDAPRDVDHLAGQLGGCVIGTHVG